MTSNQRTIAAGIAASYLETPKSRMQEGTHFWMWEKSVLLVRHQNKDHSRTYYFFKLDSVHDWFTWFATERFTTRNRPDSADVRELQGIFSYAPGPYGYWSRQKHTYLRELPATTAMVRHPFAIPTLNEPHYH